MTDKPTAETIKAIAAARGLTLTDSEARAVVTGAVWLRSCVDQLKAAGYGK